MQFNSFKFEDEEYFQHSGFAMGSPLSPVAVCLYLEMLEERHFLNIMGQETVWLRYVDDVIIVCPEEMKLEEKLQSLNNVDAQIHLTVKDEINGELPFLDTFIIRDGRNLRYKVYRKPSCKEDYIH